jgi:hypothetical protein
LAVPVGTSYTPNVFRVGRISNQRWIADHDGVSLVSEGVPRCLSLVTCHDRTH